MPDEHVVRCPKAIEGLQKSVREAVFDRAAGSASRESHGFEVEVKECRDGGDDGDDEHQQAIEIVFSGRSESVEVGVVFVLLLKHIGRYLHVHTHYFSFFR